MESVCTFIGTEGSNPSFSTIILYKNHLKLKVSFVSEPSQSDSIRVPSTKQGGIMDKILGITLIILILRTCGDGGNSNSEIELLSS